MTDTEPVTDTDPRPWWRQPSTLVVFALIVLAAGIGVGLILSAGDDDDGSGEEISTATTAAPTTTVAPTTPPTTAAAPITTAVTPTTVPARDRCVAGDQQACDTLTDEELDELCDGGRGSEDACQVLLAHQGDGVPDGDEGDGGGEGNGNGQGDGNGQGNGNGQGDGGDDPED
jgi:hypothetical protein